MKRDPKDLLVNVSEVSGLFSDATSLDTFLQRIVEIISEHMNSEVCSIYLYNEDHQELVLKATKGLMQEAIGTVRMKLGDGLTGLSLKEFRPICVQNASKSPVYKYFPGIGEEAYESFLALPICRGQNRIGAVVIQNSRKNFFSDEDVRVLRAITSQLATTIETAKVLMNLEDKRQAEDRARLVMDLKFIKGKVGSPGFACAEAIVISQRQRSLRALALRAHDQYTLGDFRQAVKKTETELEVLQEQIEERLSDVASLIFTAQILMLKDQPFIESIEKKIDSGVNPPDAVVELIEEYMGRFAALDSAYLQEKKDDVLDIGLRLVENIIGSAAAPLDFSGKIIIARDLFPSDILKYSSLGVKGIILLSGGITSHISILARSLEIPVIITDSHELLHLPPDVVVICDAENGNIHISPDKDIIDSYNKRDQERDLLEKMKAQTKPQTRTFDGERVYLMSNINLLSDLKTARDYHSEGVGLYRTEFPFIIRSNFPSEAEQYRIYKQLVDDRPGDEVTFRTLDIGGDKVLSYYDYGKEKNPYLGMRSIRFSLKHRDVFCQQLRAILRAGIGADLKIMFPMVSSLDDFQEAKKLVHDSLLKLEQEERPHHQSPKIGIMIEMPSVMEIIEELAQAADFFSIGTNDFIQYMLAVDRTNEKVADLYIPHHPAILRALKRVAAAAVKYKKDVSVCGDMAHDPLFVPFFLGIGLRKFSIDSHFLPQIQQTIEGLTINEAQKYADRLLKLDRIADVSHSLGL